MNFSPTIFMAQLLVSMHVFITLNMMPLGTTMALPVTSKPIESTVENLAWQAWIELPPEQKQQVKSRKVTPKSIFTLPLRVECPEGHKQVDTKCIPVVIGSNAVLIDLNALGLVVGNTPTDELYDYDDMDGDEEDLNNPQSQPQFGGGGDGDGEGMKIKEKEKSVESLTVELKPPTKDEPLKFNIFENKFHIFHEEPMEDYSANEGGDESENMSSSTSQQPQTATTARILSSDASNITGEETHVKSPFASLADANEFNIEAISLPVGGFETQKSQELAMFQKDSSLQVVSTIMDSDATTTISDDKLQENDIQTLLQTESFLPLFQQATAVNNSSDLSNATPADTLNLNVDEDITTMTSTIESNITAQVKNKQEFTRSVSRNPLTQDEGVNNSDDNDRVNDTTATLKTEMIDEPLETTTPIQLDETTIIETLLSLSTTPAAATQQQKQHLQQDFKELLLKQEQTENERHEQHVLPKKTKVEPVKMLLASTTTTTIANEAATETVTPLLTVHNDDENNNKNDRFYDQQDLITVTTTMATTDISKTTATTTTTEEIKRMPLTSEIDVEKELRLINELVKGKIKTATKPTLTTMQQPTTTTEIPAKTFMNNEVSTTLSSAAAAAAVADLSESSSQQLWSKIIPLTTTTTTKSTKTTDENNINSNKNLIQNTAADISNDIQTIPSNGTSTLSISNNNSRNDRNSKIIRINGFNTRNTGTIAATTIATTTTTTSSSSSSIEQTTAAPQIYEPYWWLPVSWRFDKPTTTAVESKETPSENEQVKDEEQSLLLRFWLAYQAPKSS